MQKTKRLLVIEKIISGEYISSQEELLKKLKGKGLSCTQATLSRDLRQLGVGRIADGSGGYRYMLPETARNNASPRIGISLIPVIQDIIDAKDLLVIRTLPGNASNTASFIDIASRYEIAGTIAGDDTILVIPRTGVTVTQAHSCLEMILPGLHEHIKEKGKR
ncbi:MAG TPA: ArgR family transcriptional regulator [Bacteroidales bacterium]|nr:ArgR family transcriptional regulator [Bacteroidales bacterium]